VLEFLSRLRNRGHRLIARWGEEILLETSGNQRIWTSNSGWKQWQWHRALESCQQTRLTGNGISWNLGPLHLFTALPCIARTMQKGAAVVLLQVVLIHKGTTVRVRPELRHMFPKFGRYIAARSHADVGNDKIDRTLSEEYARNKAQITIVTFLHKRVCQTNARVHTWHKPRDMSAFEHMAQGRVLWLEAKTHPNVSISIVNVHSATANQHDLQRQVTYLRRAMIHVVANIQRYSQHGTLSLWLRSVYKCAI